jgi:hypothetical protein
MATTTESTKRHMDGGEFPKMGEIEFLIRRCYELGATKNY